MALLSIHSSTPAEVSSTSVTAVTTASFTPPSEALLLVNIMHDTGSADNITTPAVATDNLSSHLTYTLIDSWAKNSSSNAGAVACYWARVVNDQPMTITATQSVNSTASGGIGLSVVVIMGASLVKPTGAKGHASSSAAAISSTYTSTLGGSWGFLANTDWGSATLPTVTAGETQVAGAVLAGHIVYWVVRQTNITPNAGTSVVMADNSGVASSVNNWVYYEVVPSTVGEPGNIGPYVHVGGGMSRNDGGS